VRNFLSGNEHSHMWELGKPVSAIAFDAKGELLAAGLQDGTIVIRRVTDGAIVTTLGTPTSQSTEVTALAFHPLGGLLASADTTNKYEETSRANVTLWDLSTGRVRYTLEGHRGAVTALAFGSQQDILASGGRDEHVRIWSTTTGQHERSLNVGQSLAGDWSHVWGLRMHPDGRTILAGTADNMVRRWQLADGTLVHEAEANEEGWFGSGYVQDMVFSPTGSMIVTANLTSIHAWDWQSGRLIKELELPNYAFSAAIAPGAPLLAVGTGRFKGADPSLSSDGHRPVYVWNMVTWQSVVELKGHTESVRALAWSPDSKLLASASDDRSVRLWLIPR
jgi:WD40 repeat protein